MTDYNALMQMLLGASPVANVAFDPYKKGINPLQATEGAMPYRGGANPRTTVTPKALTKDDVAKQINDLFARPTKPATRIKPQKGEKYSIQYHNDDAANGINVQVRDSIGNIVAQKSFMQGNQAEAWAAQKAKQFKVD
jgi:hypothetical protein